MRAAPPERGWVAGSVELEPDELRGDDVRFFALWIGEPPVVVADTGVGPFLQSAIQALIANGRAAAAGPASASTKSVAIVAADRLTQLPALITAPTDPVRLGAANRALERAGVPWRFGAPARGEAIVEGLAPSDGQLAAPESASGGAPVTVQLRYPLQAQPTAVADTLARTGTAPWIVAVLAT